MDGGGGGGGEERSIICSFSKPGPGALVLIYYLLLVVEVIRVRACETKAPIVDPFGGGERQTDRQTHLLYRLRVLSESSHADEGATRKGKRPRNAAGRE